MSSHPAFSLDDRVAVVTGAGQGIGWEIAVALRDSGATVVVAELDAAAGQAAADRLNGDFVATDVTDPASVRALAERVRSRHGRVDVLVNNAGIVRNTPAEETSDADWHAVMAVNLHGVFYCCREFGRLMLAQGKGSIVNVSSMCGLISVHPQPQAHYNASKAGVLLLTKSLAGEWASRGVRVNAIAPGYVATPLTRRGLETPEWRQVWLSETPMGRLGEPREISPVVVFLASDASSYVTGSTLSVDGGYTAW